MGNLTSKLFLNDEEVNSKSKLSTQIKMGTLEKNQEKHQCTPIMTRKELSADPRSASAGIVRTPIEVDITPTGVSRRVAKAIPKYLQPKQYLETDIDSVVPALSSAHTTLDPRSPNVPCTRTPIMVKHVPEYLTPVVKIKEAPAMDTPQMLTHKLDPRSPAADFDRTPILKPKSPKRNGPHENKNNSMECTIEVLNPQLAYCETTTDFNISEIQVLPDIVSQQPSDLKKRLDLHDEFNTSIDDCLFAKCSSDESDSDGQLTVIPNLKAMKTDEKLSSTHEIMNKELTSANEEIKTVKEDLEIITNISTLINKRTKVDTEEKIRIWRDSISPDLFEEPKSKIMTSKPEEIIIEFNQDQSISKPEKTSNVLLEKTNENTIGKEPAIKKKKTAHKPKGIINDKKSSNLTGGRTPLSNRSNSHKSEIQSKSPQQIFRSKAFSVKPYQQENTPPRSKNLNSKIKSSNAQWDLDKTVII
ncbi:GSCOCG00006773001-RA-CDS [Cotesia congregata]|uniref:Uncharacterized protein n=1 Tax=Cotesia congregata TaxID=51543 RepID=A0A8J2MQS5_COTCN|nr:GSCOCG00006773001-RA-CDS [Cotesia congregata]CAG5103561.1 Protein of unknown function [Cotesia congregata]